MRWITTLPQQIASSIHKRKYKLFVKEFEDLSRTSPKPIIESWMFLELSKDRPRLCYKNNLDIALKVFFYLESREQFHFQYGAC